MRHYDFLRKLINQRRFRKPFNNMGVGKNADDVQRQLDYQLAQQCECENELEPVLEHAALPLLGVQGKTSQPLSIYSGIGLGVYEGEIVVLRQMSIGKRSWVVSKLRIDDFRYLQEESLSSLQCLLDFVYLYRKQPLSLKMDSQTLFDIKLMRSYLQKHEHPCNSPSPVKGDYIPAIADTMQLMRQQSQEGLEQNSQLPFSKQSNTDDNHNQPLSTHERKENDRPDEPTTRS